MVEGIAAASISMSQAKVQQAVSTALLKDAMDTQTAQADQMLRYFEAAVTGLGQNIDLMA